MQRPPSTAPTVRAVLLGALLAAGAAVAVQQWTLSVAPISVAVGAAIGGAALGYVGAVSGWSGTWLPSLITGVVATLACMAVMARTGVAVLRADYAVSWLLSVLAGTAIAIPLTRLGGKLRAEDG